jgi:cyanophycinase
MVADEVRGPFSLSGATRWSDGSFIDAELVAEAGGSVVILPTGAAYERPDRIIEGAVAHFGAMGASVEAAMVLRRQDAEDTELAAMVRRATFLYLCGGSPLHMRSVLKDSLVLDAIVGAWRDGAVVAGQGAGTVVLTDPMVDPRGGAFTVGLGLIRNCAAISSAATSGTSGIRRTISLLPSECALVELGPSGAIVRSPEGQWRSVGEVEIYVAQQPAGLEALAGKSVW